MPRCVNVPADCKPLYYKGTELTPLGIGYSPKHESIGTRRIGRDGRPYTVGYEGVDRHVWVWMWWLKEQK
jgi:hypothetical protein